MKNAKWPYAYGDIVVETNSYDFVKSEQDRLVEYHGYNRGDIPKNIDTTKYKYVLVISDEHYADVEYRELSTQTILARGEIE